MARDDDLLELRIECEDCRRRIRAVEARIEELVRLPHAAGIPCAAEILLNEARETLTHEVAPPDDGFALRDEPPSHPV